MARIGLFEFAFALSVVGALTLIIFSLFRLFGIADVIIPYYWLIPSRYLFPVVGGLTGDIIINTVCGVIALISSRKIHSLARTVVLIVVGVIAGGVGGTLVLLGGILGLIGKLT
jgi:hypothetical protein